MGLVKSAYIKENFGGNKMFKKLKNKKGFTLVELIVVLVILAILAAMLIPALTGYIDKARNKQIIAETRSAVMAAQTLVDEAYSKSTKTVTATGDTADTTKVVVGSEDVTYEAIATLGEINKDYIKGVKINEKGKIVELVYTSGKTCTYSPDTKVDAANDSEGSYYITNATA